MKFLAEEQFKWEDKWKSSVRWISRMFNDTLLWGWMWIMSSFCIFPFLWIQISKKKISKNFKTWLTNCAYVNWNEKTLLCAAEKRRISDEITWEFNQMPQKLCFLQLCSLTNETSEQTLCCRAAIKVLSVLSANIDPNLNNFSLKVEASRYGNSRLREHVSQ